MKTNGYVTRSFWHDILKCECMLGLFCEINDVLQLETEGLVIYPCSSVPLKTYMFCCIKIKINSFINNLIIHIIHLYYLIADVFIVDLDLDFEITIAETMDNYQDKNSITYSLCQKSRHTL